MKSAWLIVAVLASVVAGAGGGYVATHFAADKQQSKVASLEPAALDGEEKTAEVDNSDQLSKLQHDIDGLLVRLEKAEGANTDAAALQKKIDALNTQIAELKAASPVLTKPADGVSPELPPQTEEFKAAVRNEYNAIKAEEEAAEKAADEKRRKEMADGYNKGIVDKLTTELSLDETQKANITTVLGDRSTKFADLGKRAGEAREKGEDFDFRAEMKVLNDATLVAVKAELSSSQVSTLDALLGEGGNLDSLGGWGGMRGGTRGGGNNGGGNRGGRGQD